MTANGISRIDSRHKKKTKTNEFRAIVDEFTSKRFLEIEIEKRKTVSCIENGEIGFVSSVFGQQHECKHVDEYQDNRTNDETI